MKQMVKDSLKGMIMFGLIGAVVGLGAPLVMGALLGAETAGALGAVSVAGMLHTGVVFGLFGLLEPVVKTVFGFIFGEKKEEAAKDQAPERKKVHLTIIQGPEMAQDVCQSGFRQIVEAQRLVASGDKAVSIQ